MSYGQIWHSGNCILMQFIIKLPLDKRKSGYLTKFLKDLKKKERRIVKFCSLRFLSGIKMKDLWRVPENPYNICSSYTCPSKIYNYSFPFPLQFPASRRFFEICQKTCFLAAMATVLYAHYSPDTSIPDHVIVLSQNSA